MLSFAAIIQLIGVAQKIVEAGAPAWEAVKRALAAQGIEADTAELDRVILDADRRRAEAEAESRAEK